MIDTDKLADAELAQQAAEWRQRALQGDPKARGIAHQLEAVLRRRNGALFTSYDTLDMRSLERKQKKASWWQFWRREQPM